jgi:hypothetical protein
MPVIAARRRRVGVVRRQAVERLGCWLAPEQRYFKVWGEDGACYILRHDAAASRRELTVYDRTWRDRLNGASEGIGSMGRWLIIFGVVLIVVGLLWPVLERFGLGRLPGDIVIERENFRLYFPIVTSLIVSVVLSVILWLLNR